MVTLSRRTLTAELRRLSAKEFGEFVAAIWRARNWDVTTESSILHVSSLESDAQALVVTDLRSVLQLVDDPTFDIVVLGPGIWGSVGQTLIRVTGLSGRELEIVTSRDLYETFAFGIDPQTRKSLSSKFLDGPPVDNSPTDRHVFIDGLFENHLTSGLWFGFVFIVGILIISGFAWGGLLSSGPFSSSSADGMVTPVETPTPSHQLTPSNMQLPETCSPPPLLSHPAMLRPAVRSGASSGGLDGWELVATQNISRYEFDPNDQRADVVPEERHIAFYRVATGSAFRFVADRWETDERARTAEKKRRNDFSIVWGRYVLSVEQGNVSQTTKARSRELLAAVSGPNGPQLGEVCVADLIETT